MPRSSRLSHASFPPLAPKALAEELRSIGTESVSLAKILADIAAGAPTNPEGTISIVHYAAWLIQERGDRAETQ